mmetsp:Transcript_12123/g.13703  ORF Transcript_12123/g.13703 Transcript_12123/m.13703 type:complete len:87 (+) Transcript_12123:2291-2551(+)
MCGSEEFIGHVTRRANDNDNDEMKMIIIRKNIIPIIKTKDAKVDRELEHGHGYGHRHVFMISSGLVLFGPTIVQYIPSTVHSSTGK